MSTAFVTLATNDSYALGALVLAKSLHNTQTSHKAIVLVGHEVSKDLVQRLQKTFDEVINVEMLDSKDAKSLELLKRPELGITFTKIHIWKLTQYKKLVFLDADTLVLKNIDELFDHPEFSAAPDVGWPDCFNSGVFVLTPNMATYDALVKHAESSGSFDGGDQGLLNEFFSSWNRLSFIYNVTPTSFYSYAPALKRFFNDIKVIHFIGMRKPWNSRFGNQNISQEMLDLWWNIHDQYFSEQPTPGLYATTSQGPSYVAVEVSSSTNSSSGTDPKNLPLDRLAHLDKFANYRISWSDTEILDQTLLPQIEQITERKVYNSVQEMINDIVEEMKKINIQLAHFRTDQKKYEKPIEKLQERLSELTDILTKLKAGA